MATPQQLWTATSSALGAQGFRRLKVESLPSMEVTWPTTGQAVIDSALIGVTQTPNWEEIGRELRALTETSGFAGLFLRRTNHYLQVALVQWFTGQVNLALLNREADHVWGYIPTLARLVDHFHLSDQAKQKLAAALELALQGSSGFVPAGATTAGAQQETASGWDFPPGDVAPAAQAPASQQSPTEAARPSGGVPPGWRALIYAALQLANDLWQVGSAQANLVTIGLGGLASDAVGRLEGITGIKKEDNWAVSFHVPNLSAVGIDGQTGAAHGHTWPGTINVGELGRQVAYQLNRAT